MYDVKAMSDKFPKVALAILTGESSLWVNQFALLVTDIQ